MMFQMRSGVKFRSGADPPLEVVSGLHYWWAAPVWTDNLEAQSGGVSVVQSVNYTGPSLIKYREIFHKATLQDQTKVT